MYNKGWNKLIKRNDSYKYQLEASVEKKYCTGRLNFTQLAFDQIEECLIVADTENYLHCIELSEDDVYYKKLEKVGRVTFLAFNPICKKEILIGLNTGEIKIWKLYTDTNEFSLLSGHKLPPIHVSFYKSHCLTSSRNEVIIWYLKSYSKIYQLKVSAKDAVIRKAVFSNAGHIVVLYHNDTMQTWMFNQLNKDTKIDIKIFGEHYVKDFIFTRDGRAIIMIGLKSISILSTYDWCLLRKLYLPENFEAKQLAIVPRPLDGGANNIIAFLSSKCTLHFCDINISNFVKTPDLSRIRKFSVSSIGKYIAYVDQEGCLNIMHMDKIITKKCIQSKKLLEPYRPYAHKINDHLDCIRENMKRELNIKRLIPILEEFGEYPERYRAVIWATILKLPSNKTAYLALVNKVTYERCSLDILKNYSLADRSKSSLLAMTIGCLQQWCSLLVQSQFLPNLIFPFLVVFQKDPLLAFELILTILLNYCQNWFEYHPLSPVNILGIVENVLLEVDPVLSNIFFEYGITSSEYAWPLLQTAMSEVLSGNEWLILWDHLITFQKPSLLLMCVIAYNIYSKKNIISLLKSSKDIKEFYSTQGHVRAKDLLKIARKLDREIPERIHPNRYLRDKLLRLNHTGPYSLFILKEYPKFITENVCTTDLEKCKAHEHKQDYNKVAELERKKLHDDINAFEKQIHETRLNEVQKCFQKHISNSDWKLNNIILKTERNKLYCHQMYKDSHDIRPEKIQTCNKCKSLNKISNFKDIKLKNYRKLQQDVTQLECEVQSFLDLLKFDK